MTVSTPTLPLKNLRPGRKLILFSVASVLVHLLALQLLSGRNQIAVEAPAARKTVQVSLRAANASAPAALENTTTPAAAQESGTQIAHKKRVRNAEPASAVEQPVASNVSAPAPINEPESASRLADTQATENPPAAPPEPSTPTDAPKYASRAPESAHMRMQVVRVEANRNPMYGVASIDWENNDGRYKMNIEVGLDLLLTTVNLYKLSSRGRAGAAGIIPAISTEARRSRAETATHFNHEEKTISFSASSATLPMSDGAQDKASFLMQLAAIGNADPSQFSAGREILIQVAEEKDAALFQFKIVDQEEIDTKIGKLMSWHLLRPPRPGSYNSQLEIWLAPATGWFPVQIRNTESNGTVTTQTVTNFRNKTDMER